MNSYFILNCVNIYIYVTNRPDRNKQIEVIIWLWETLVPIKSLTLYFSPYTAQNVSCMWQVHSGVFVYSCVFVWPGHNQSLYWDADICNFSNTIIYFGSTTAFYRLYRVQNISILLREQEACNEAMRNIITALVVDCRASPVNISTNSFSLNVEGYFVITDYNLRSFLWVVITFMPLL